MWLLLWLIPRLVLLLDVGQHAENLQKAGQQDTHLLVGGPTAYTQTRVWRATRQETRLTPGGVCSTPAHEVLLVYLYALRSPLPLRICGGGLSLQVLEKHGH